jgi:hypothetical protein
MLLDWCDETTGTTAPKYLAYDIANGSFPLPSTVQFTVAVVSVVGTTKRCVLSMV